MQLGRYQRLSPGRRIVAEILHHGRQVPTLATSRRADVSALVAARQRSADPPSWLAIFIKAYGLAAQRHEELRTAWISYPWPRLYVHPFTAGAVPIERQWNGEPVVLMAKFAGPENQTLSDIHDHLQRFKTAPVSEVSEFRQMLRLASTPTLWQRWVMWHSLHWSGDKRARRFGTCIISSLGGFGVQQNHPITPLTTYFSAGPVEANGTVNLTIIYDHRVMDDSPVARCLVSLEEILNTDIAEELQPQILQFALHRQIPQQHRRAA